MISTLILNLHLDIWNQGFNTKIKIKITVFNFTKTPVSEDVSSRLFGWWPNFSSVWKRTYRRGWNRSWSLKHTYYVTQTGYICISVFVPCDVSSPPSMSMLVPLGTGKSILWLGIISAQCDTTAIVADKTGIKRSPSRSRPAVGF